MKGWDFTMHFNNPEAKERIKWSTQVYSTFHGRAAIQFISLMVEEKVMISFKRIYNKYMRRDTP